MSSVAQEGGLGPAVSHPDRTAFESAVWRKFDRRILPIVSMMYFLSFLVIIFCLGQSVHKKLINLHFQDRINIGNAQVVGMQRDLKMTNHQARYQCLTTDSSINQCISLFSIALR
jgi:hypothetical protein